MQQFIRAIIVNNNNYLLIKEKKGQHYNCWNFAGGKVALNEDVASACKREVKEELNLEIENLELFHTGYFSYPIIGDWEGFYSICSTVNIDEIKILEPSKCYGYCWFSLEELRNQQQLGITLDLVDKLEKITINSK